jgi:hypothetical protein
MGDYRINLVCCTDTICDEIKLGTTQKSLAVTYAMAMKSAAEGADKPDWYKINTAILAKWKMSGLERIKKRAHDILSGKIQL